jgi:DNA primase
LSDDSLLAKLIDEDYGLELRGRWGRSDTKSSLVYDAQKDLFYYNKDDICGDAFTYLTQMRGWDFSTTKEFLKKNNFTATFVQEIKDGQESIVYPKLLEIWSENLEEGDKTYFYNRMLTDETIHRFRLGFFNNFYTIPIFMDGTLKQFQMRRDSPKLIKNYYSGVGPLLFHSEILQITDKVYLTEGLIGTILLSQMGVPACSMNIGVDGFQPTWVRYFKNIKEVVILNDNDEAGVNGSQRTARILGQHRCRIYTFNDFDAKGYAVDDFLIDGFGIEDLEERIKIFGKFAFEYEEKKKYDSFRKRS